MIAHNKTLAAQLCNEFRTFFPRNAVEYFVSYYDYYQPEAYVPSKDLYIEKDSAINQEIDRLRHAATAALFARRDVLIVASVSSIYGLGSPEVYDENLQTLVKGAMIDRDGLLRKLVSIQYNRNDTALARGTFRVRGETLEIWPAYAETAYRIGMFGDEVEHLQHFDPVTGELIEDDLEHVAIWPASHYNVREGHDRGRRRRRSARSSRSAAPSSRRRASCSSPTGCASAPSTTWRCCARWASAAASRTTAGSSTAASPASARTACSTTSRTTSSASSTSPTRRCRRSAACTRATASASRRSSTTASGCRARSTTARRPSRSSSSITPQIVFVSATPGEYERTHSHSAIVEQIVRPTGIVDPEIEVRETKNQIDDLMNEIRRRVERDERTLVTTLTKKMSEDLTDYLLEMGFKVRYLHSEVDTLERIQIIRELRLGEFDVLVGVNLLREGLDLPEVSLVAILDADKEGFLRGATSLIQTIGRAARNVDGKVLMYADKETAAMRAAIEETDRRREIQVAYNESTGSRRRRSSRASPTSPSSCSPTPRSRSRGAAASARPRARCRRPRSSAGSSSWRRRCSPPPRICASSTPPSCATRSATSSASSTSRVADGRA